MRPFLLRLHRWTSLIFALPLFVIIATGLILSFQPALQHAAIKPGSLSPERLIAMIEQHDPERNARALNIDPMDNRLMLSGPGGNLAIDLSSGETMGEASALSTLFWQSRRIHERLVYGLDPLVPIATGALLGLIALGLMMGWGTWRNNVPGWHRGIAWTLLPLLIISPLTGLALTFSISFTSPAPRAPAMPLREALSLVLANKDPSTLLYIAQRGGRQMVRVMEDGAVRHFLATPEGLKPLENNWPRLIHEGTWRGMWSGAVNIVTSLALLALLFTGVWIWMRRHLRPRRKRAETGPIGAHLTR